MAYTPDKLRSRDLLAAVVALPVIAIHCIATAVYIVVNFFVCLISDGHLRNYRSNLKFYLSKLWK